MEDLKLREAKTLQAKYELLYHQKSEKCSLLEADNQSLREANKKAIKYVKMSVVAWGLFLLIIGVMVVI